MIRDEEIKLREIGTKLARLREMKARETEGEGQMGRSEQRGRGET